MMQVSTQEELRAAILAQEAEIQVIADFDVSVPQNVTYSLLLHSAPIGPVHTLSKTAGFSGSLLRVSGGGALTLENLVLDGSAAGSYLENPSNRTLVQVAGGSIHLTFGAVLQNNSSYQEGGGLYLSGDASYVNVLLMDSDATIRGCNSRTSGGGLTAALRNNGDSVRLEGTALIEQNTAANGAGVYLRSYLAEVGGDLSIGERVQIHNNRASGNGGGVYCSSFSTGGSASLSLTVEGEVDISSNQASFGGGIYFYSANLGDQLTMTGSIHIAENVVTGSGGGLYCNAPRDSVSLSIQDVSITDNHAANGGGVYLRTMAGGTLEVTGQATLSGNTATGATSSAGGGLWIQNISGTLAAVFSSASILSNQAAGNGGGLFLSNSGTVDFRMSGDIISRNTSGASGGGLYLINYGDVMGVLDMEDVIISDNIAGTMGGGIYHTGEQVLALESVTIDQNTAPIGQGVYNAGSLDLGPIVACPDRLYILNQDAVPTIAEHLASGSVVQLERSDYVTPNQTGTPIVVARSDLELTSADEVAFRIPPSGFAGWWFRLSEDKHQVLLTPIEYRLQYENNLGVENPNPGRYTSYTPTITLIPLVDIPGNLFLGWFDALEGGTQVTEIPQGSIGDKTLYARWQVVEYTVTYYGNDAEGSMAENVPPPQQVRGGESTLLSDEIPTRTGYVFIGWNTEPDGSGTPYPPGGTILNVTADIGIYAQWEALPPTLHLLTYESNDAGGSPAQGIPGQREIPEGETTELSAAIPTRSGYRFLGWNTTPDGTGMDYQPGQTVGPFYADLTLYAPWQCVEHILTYHGNDEAGPPAQWIPFPQSVPEGQVISLPGVIPTREGFRFTGWNTQSDGGGITYQPDDSFGPIFADADLYAQWVVLPPMIHTLTYCSNDAGGTPTCCLPCSQRILVGQCVQISCCTPYRACYSFISWNTDLYGRGQMIYPGQVIGPVTGDICLYAQWRHLPPPKPYCICCGESG